MRNHGEDEKVSAVYWLCLVQAVSWSGADNVNSESAALLGDPDFPKILDPATYGERIMRFQKLYKQYSRLDLSSYCDRPTAIDGLQQRLIRTMGVHGGFGVFHDPNKSSLLHRSLLWHRGADIERLKPIAFPEDGEPVPSWSWMSVSGGIDYFTLEWRQYDWQEIGAPWPYSSSKIPNAFYGLSRAFDLSNTRASEHDLVFDDPRNDDPSERMAIVLGIEKGLKVDQAKKHYVLVVRLIAISSAIGAARYRRIGAGYILGKCLRGDPEPCWLV